MINSSACTLCLSKGVPENTNRISRIRTEITTPLHPTPPPLDTHPALPTLIVHHGVAAPSSLPQRPIAPVSSSSIAAAATAAGAATCAGRCPYLCLIARLIVSIPCISTAAAAVPPLPTSAAHTTASSLLHEHNDCRRDCCQTTTSTSQATPFIIVDDVIGAATHAIIII